MLIVIISSSYLRINQNIRIFLGHFAYFFINVLYIFSNYDNHDSFLQIYRIHSVIFLGYSVSNEFISRK